MSSDRPFRGGTAAVTGTSGRVGDAVAEALAAAGWLVHGVDRRPGRRTTLVGELRDARVRRDLDYTTRVPPRALSATTPRTPSSG